MFASVMIVRTRSQMQAAKHVVEILGIPDILKLGKTYSDQGKRLRGRLGYLSDRHCPPPLAPPSHNQAGHQEFRFAPASSAPKALRQGLDRLGSLGFSIADPLGSPGVSIAVGSLSPWGEPVGSLRFLGELRGPWPLGKLVGFCEPWVRVAPWKVQLRQNLGHIVRTVQSSKGELYAVTT